METNYKALKAALTKRFYLCNEDFNTIIFIKSN